MPAMRTGQPCLDPLEWACSLKFQPHTGGDWYRPDCSGVGGMPRTLTWPGKSREQTLTANNDVAGRVGFQAASVRMAA